MFYLYRFLNSCGEIIYIGRTKNIYRRIIKEHFSQNTHLPDECYFETDRIEVTEIDNESEEVAFEAILINKIRPKYNTQFVDEGNFHLELPKFSWADFKWEYENQLDWLKKQKQHTINLNDGILNSLYEPLTMLTTGLVEIDINSPILNNSLTLIAGVSGIGKTSYTFGILESNRKRDKKILYINLKESVQELSLKILSYITCSPLNEIISTGFTLEDEEHSKITEIYNSIGDSIVLYNIKTNGYSLHNILKEIAINNYDLVIIDELHIIETPESTYNKDKMDFILKNLKLTAIQCSVPIVLAFSLSNKLINRRVDKRPNLNDFEYDSLLVYPDNIHMIYRDDFYNKDSEYLNTAEIIVTKNSMNNFINAKVAFVGGRFVNLEE